MGYFLKGEEGLSDSMNDCARELAKLLYPMYCKHFNGMFCDVCAPKHILVALTDAFNLGISEARLEIREESHHGDDLARRTSGTTSSKVARRSLY